MLMHEKTCVIPILTTIGITHVFHALTSAGSRGSCLNTRLIGRVLKHLRRDHAMNQTCVIVILILTTETQLKH